MAYFFKTGNVKFTATITVKDSIKIILRCKGFTTEDKRNILYDYLIYSFSAIRVFSEEHISNLSTDFHGRTQANGKIKFGTGRTERTIALLHWVQYLYRISGDPTMFDLNKVLFIQQFNTAIYSSEIRNKLIVQSNTNDKVASLGPLEPESKWK